MSESLYQNNGRQEEFDVARGFAVFFMVLIHCTEFFWNGENPVFNKIANFLGSPPSAPVFMFILGCGIIYSRHNSPGELLHRGLWILLLSYVFNAIVYVAPYGIYSLIHRDPECWENSWSQVYDADILQFAGLAFLFFALMQKLDLKSWVYVVVGIVLSLGGMILNWLVTDFDQPILQAISGLFWGSHEGSYFPFLSWIPYPIAGYLFADVLRETHPDYKGELYMSVSIPSGLICVVTGVILLRFNAWDDLMDGELYYHQSIFLQVLFISFVLMWMGIAYILSRKLPSVVMKFLKVLSSRVTLFYCFQYFFIFYIQVLIFKGNPELNVPLTLVMFFGISLCSYFASSGYSYLLKSTKRKTVLVYNY